jgi:hypothetical protein
MKVLPTWIEYGNLVKAVKANRHRYQPQGCFGGPGARSVYPPRRHRRDQEHHGAGSRDHQGGRRTGDLLQVHEEGAVVQERQPGLRFRGQQRQANEGAAAGGGARPRLRPARVAAPGAHPSQLRIPPQRAARVPRRLGAQLRIAGALYRGFSSISRRANFPGCARAWCDRKPGRASPATSIWASACGWARAN